jgi:hypothetical protein
MRGYDPIDRKSFQKSLEVACQYRDLLSRLAGSFASKERCHELADRVDALEGMLKGFQEKL